VKPLFEHGSARPPALVLAAWLVAAFLSTVCGIGGGLFAVPILHYLGALPMRVAIGTSLLLVCVLSATATAAEASHAASALSAPIAALLIAGGMLGARAGFAVAQRMETVLLKKLFVLVLVFSGVRILALDPGVLERAGDAAVFRATLGSSLAVAAIGFAGGFLAPLLGVGGGLIVVPALLLTMDSVGYLEARANSLAMTVVVSAQSAWLYLRARLVHVESAPWYAGGAGAAALLGVFAVHQPGWVAIARVILASVLLCVAARFAWDAWRLPRPGGARGEASE